MRWRSGFLALLVIGLLMIGFTTCDGNKTQKDSSEDKSDSSEESKERDKRSDEEIMFGNQQNKANGLVDEFLMGVDAKNDDKKDAKNDTEKKDADDSKMDESSKTDVKEETKKEVSSEKISDEMTDSSSDSSDASPGWYGGNNNSPGSAEALQYILHSRPLQPISPSNSFVDVRGVFDQSDLYRRKRAPISRPVTLMKRSLRSPIGQMIRTRRLPRRSMRLKRQVDVEQILSMLRNAESNNRDTGYYKPNPERFGSSFRHRNFPFSYPYGEEENVRNENEEEDSSIDNKDFTDSLMYPPSSRYFDVPEYPVPSHYQSKESETEVLPRWLEERAPAPSIFTVSRRSTPLFYPVDYRFVPGYKKRSSMMEDNEGEGETPMSFGKWGRVVDVPGAYASAEDVARLYALANLLAESENPDGVMRRRAA